MDSFIQISAAESTPHIASSDEEVDSLLDDFLLPSIEDVNKDKQDVTIERFIEDLLCLFSSSTDRLQKVSRLVSSLAAATKPANTYLQERKGKNLQKEISKLEAAKASEIASLKKQLENNVQTISNLNEKLELLNKQISEQEALIKELKTNERQSKDMCQNNDATIAELRKVESQLKDDNINKERTISALRDENAKFASDSKKKDEHIKKLQQKANEIGASSQDKEQKISDYESNLRKLKSDIQDHVANIATLQSRNSTLENQLTAEQGKLKLANQNHLSEMESVFADFNKELKKPKPNEITGPEAYREWLKKEIATVVKERAQKFNELDDLHEQQKKLENNLQLQQTELKKCQQKYEDCRGQLDKALEEKQRFEDEKGQLQKLIAEKDDMLEKEKVTNEQNKLYHTRNAKAAKKKLDEAIEKCQTLERELSQLEDRNRELDEMVNELKGQLMQKRANERDTDQNEEQHDRFTVGHVPADVRDLLAKSVKK